MRQRYIGNFFNEHHRSPRSTSIRRPLTWQEPARWEETGDVMESTADEIAAAQAEVAGGPGR